MTVTISKEEITEDETAAISGFLARVKDGEIPNIEALDGFLTALVISPDLVKPSEFTPVIIRGATEDGDLVFENNDEAETFFGIIMNHWNRINRAYRSGDVYMPLLLEDMNGEVRGNNWARGFLRGTHFRRAHWLEVSQSEEHGGPFIYIWSLVYEDHPDTEVRSNKTPFTKEQRDKLITGIIAGAKQLYDFFQKQRSAPRKAAARGAPWADPDTPEVLGSSRAKVGRNDTCPCGSGKKYKKCCGAVVLH